MQRIMKKVLCAALLLFSFVFAFGQSNKSASVKDVKNITFYGVDFSISKAYGVVNTPSELKKAYTGINGLFITESKKFNVPSFFKKDEVTNNFDLVNKLNDEMNESGMIVNSKKPVIAPEQLAAHVKSYKTGGKGVGLVFVAECLDKQFEIGYYHVVFFDEATGDILYTKAVSGKAAGFGLRNYWAGSIYKIMKDWRY